jgi:hypothetical protein
MASEQTTVEDMIIEGNHTPGIYFWVWHENAWQVAHYAGQFGIFETMHQDALDYLDFEGVPAILIEPPQAPENDKP